MLFLYNCSIWLYALIVRLIAPFHPRAKLFLEQRTGIFENMEADFRAHRGQLVWIHAASLGEFEQARPIIELLKDKRPELKILLTFFSPSGYVVQKGFPRADFVHYLPLDTPGNARRFLALAKPDLAILIKYELWYHFLMELHRREVPVLLASAIFRESQMYFHPLGRFYLQAIKTISHFFVQDSFSAKLLSRAGVRDFTVSGDTRFDRVLSIAAEAREFPVLEAFKGTEKLMVLGSVWPSDMEQLLPFVKAHREEMKFIIAPHNIREEDIRPLETADSIRYSEAGERVASKRILILDTMGMLAAVYRYGDFAVVGGAFRGALHNTLEPAAFGLPVFFGTHPANEKFIEAMELAEVGGADSFEDYEELELKFSQIWQDEAAYKQMSDRAKAFVASRGGASEHVAAKVLELLPEGMQSKKE